MCEKVPMTEKDRFSRSKEREVPIQSDVLGSYTGRSASPYEIPVQDADDL